MTDEKRTSISQSMCIRLLAIVLGIHAHLRRKFKEPKMLNAATLNLISVPIHLGEGGGRPNVDLNDSTSLTAILLYGLYMSLSKIVEFLACSMRRLPCCTQTININLYRDHFGCVCVFFFLFFCFSRCFCRILRSLSASLGSLFLFSFSHYW